MKRAMIVQPTTGRAEEEISQTYDDAFEVLTKKGYVVVESEEGIINSEVKHEDIYNISKSLNLLSKSDAAYFCMGWHTSPRCNVVHRVSRANGLELAYEGVSYNEQDVSSERERTHT